MKEETRRALKMKQAGQKSNGNTDVTHDQNEDIHSFNNYISSNIVFDADDLIDDQDIIQEQAPMRDDAGSIQDLSFLLDTQKTIADEIQRRQKMERANEAAISKLIKEDAIEQFNMEDATAAMEKLVQEEEAFYQSQALNTPDTDLSKLKSFSVDDEKKES